MTVLLLFIHIELDEFTEFFFELFVIAFGSRNFAETMDVSFDIIGGSHQCRIGSNKETKHELGNGNNVIRRPELRHQNQ